MNKADKGECKIRVTSTIFKIHRECQENTESTLDGVHVNLVKICVIPVNSAIAGLRERPCCFRICLLTRAPYFARYPRFTCFPSAPHVRCSAQRGVSNSDPRPTISAAVTHTPGVASPGRRLQFSNPSSQIPAVQTTPACSRHTSTVPTGRSEWLPPPGPWASAPACPRASAASLFLVVRRPPYAP